MSVARRKGDHCDDLPRDRHDHWYDSTGRLSAVYDALGNHDSYTFDGGNNLTQKQDRRGFNWNNTYDGNGNLLTAKDPYTNTTTYTYNSHNKPLTTTLPSGRSTAVAYDAYDNPTQVQEKDAGGTVLATTSYAYSYGLVSRKIDANTHFTYYTYDGNGYLSSVTTPLGHQTQWACDALGFQTSRTDAMNRTTTYTPDAWERRVTTTYPDSTTNTYGYDPNGNLTAFANYTAAWSRAYDADKRQTGEYIGPTRIVAHSYDAAGQKGLLSTTTDTDGRVISYAYTARNELSSVSEAAGTTSYAYDAAGNQTHLYLPNGVRTDQYYNNDNTLDSYYNWDGASTIFQSYGYNADTQITGCNEALNYAPYGSPNVSPTTYGYDSQGRLTSENRTGSSPNSQGYGYDGAGNRTNVSGGNPFTYDFDDRLVSLTAGGTTMTYRYDALGRQVSRSVNGALTGFYLNGDQPLVEKGPAGGTTQYTWGNGLIRCNGEYPLTDGRGNVRLTLDGSRNLTSSNAPDAFGIGSFTANTASVYQWNGGAGYRTEGLAPTGLSVAYSLQKVGDRYYDPTLGCFLTRDTELGQKPYAYCDGDPVNCTDPSGHQAKKDDKKHQVSEALAKMAVGFGAGGLLLEAVVTPSNFLLLALLRQTEGVFDRCRNSGGGRNCLLHRKPSCCF